MVVDLEPKFKTNHRTDFPTGLVASVNLSQTANTITSTTCIHRDSGTDRKQTFRLYKPAKQLISVMLQIFYPGLSKKQSQNQSFITPGIQRDTVLQSSLLYLRCIQDSLSCNNCKKSKDYIQCSMSVIVYKVHLRFLIVQCSGFPSCHTVSMKVLKSDLSLAEQQTCISSWAAHPLEKLHFPHHVARWNNR